MYKFLNIKWQIIFGFLFMISVIPFFCFSSKEDNTHASKNELFNPQLVKWNSMDKVYLYVDSVYDNYKFSQFDTVKYVQISSQFIKERFYHGLTNYSYGNNWIAWLSGKILWSHLSAVVDPDDILNHSKGLCSQQTIVFMELLKRKGINVRSLGLGYKEGPGHFICEVYYKGDWRLYDVTNEPEWDRLTNTHLSMDYYLANKDSLYKVYQDNMTFTVFNKLIEKVNYGKINEFPAEKMLLFHRISRALTYIIPLLFLFLSIWFYSNKK